MKDELNPYEASRQGVANGTSVTPLGVRLLTYLAFGFVGLVVGSHVSVHVGNSWYPDEAGSDFAVDTIAAVLSSPIAMTFGLFPSLGFYGPLHGVLMLFGMVLTGIGTWLYFQSRRLVYGWLVLVGVMLWSHNNHLAFAAIMSV